MTICDKNVNHACMQLYIMFAKNACRAKISMPQPRAWKKIKLAKPMKSLNQARLFKVALYIGLYRLKFLHVHMQINKK
jgi:hypothetical protein